MNLLHSAIKSRNLSRMGRPIQGFRSVLRDSPRSFSTEAQQPLNLDSILQSTPRGLFYGRLLGINTYTTKSDVVNMLEGCNLSVDDIKVEYNRAYAPASMLVQFPSKSEYDAAIRTLGRKGRLFKVETADRAQWDSVVPFDGKAVLLQGIPRNALPDDVERFLSGCQYDSSFQLFARQAFPEPIRMAVVRFPSSTLATHAFITKNRGFCLNNQISVRVLQ